MLGAFALVDGFGVGLGRTAVRLETTEFAHGAGRRAHYGGGLVTAFQLMGRGMLGVAGEEDGVPLEFDGDDELLLRAGFTRSDLRPARSRSAGGEVGLGAVVGLEGGDAGDDGVVAPGLGVGGRIGWRREDGGDGSDEVVLGVGGEGVGEVGGCGHGGWL